MSTNVEEFFYCREAALEMRRLLDNFRSTFDLAIVADFLERQRAAAVEAYELDHRVSTPSYSTVAVNQLIAHLEARKLDEQTASLIAALRSSLQVRL